VGGRKREKRGGGEKEERRSRERGEKGEEEKEGRTIMNRGDMYALRAAIFVEELETEIM